MRVLAIFAFLVLTAGYSYAATPRTLHADASVARGPSPATVTDRPVEYGRDLKVYTFDDAMGAATTQGWTSVDSSGFGDYTALVKGDTVLQEDPNVTNNTHFWAFFNGSTENYACGGHPEQIAVPHGGLFNVVVSPWIDLSVDKDGAPFSSEFTGLELAYDVYRDLPFDNLVFYQESIRFLVGGSPTDWQGGDFIYYSPNKDWFGRRASGFDIPPGATHVQVLIGARDACPLWCGIYGSGMCHSHAPLIDNVHVTRTFGIIQTVINTNPAGGGSLTNAINVCNVHPGEDVILFNIPGPGPHIIQPLSDLPYITDALIIDGFSQLGASPNTSPMGAPCDAQWVVHIDGQPNNLRDGLRFQAPGKVRGLVIENLSLGVVAQADDVVVDGNYIRGCVLSGVLSVGNNTRIGGAAPAARNIISGNDSGVSLAGNIVGAEIYGNYIGVDCDGVTPYGNAGGISIADGPTGARVGSSQNIKVPDPQEANVIANNTVYGVSIRDSNVFNNLVIGNSIYANGYQAIDLNVDGPTPNDPGDIDTGPNQLQNYPDIDYATAFEVSGVMSGAPNTNLLLHFYRSSACGDGKVFLEGYAVTTDGSGTAGFLFTPVAPIPPASYITVTATDILGNTSELSPCVLSTNTPAGSNVSAPLVDSNGVQRGVATFDNVVATGNTYLETPYTPAVYLSSDFYAGPAADEPSLYLDLTTDAEYKKGIDVCLNYDPQNIPGPESALQLVHWNGLRWVAVTTSVDERNHIICGQVFSLSPFVIAVSTATGIKDTPIPSTFALRSNVPNPFNPVTTISYDVPAGGAEVSIVIYDAAGRRVRALVNQHRGAGTWSAQWNGEDDRGRRVASGVYFYRMQANQFVETKKMVLLK